MLRPGGGLAVIWNSWDESVPWVGAMQDIVHEHAGDAPRQANSTWQRELAGHRAVHAIQQERTFANIVPGDLDAVLARVASTSYIAALEPAAAPGRARARARGASAADERRPAPCDQIEMPYATHLVWCLARGGRGRRRETSAADAEGAAARLELGEHLVGVDALLGRQRPGGRDRPAGQQPHRRRRRGGRGDDRAAEPEVRIGPRPHRDRAPGRRADGDQVDGDRLAPRPAPPRARPAATSSAGAPTSSLSRVEQRRRQRQPEARLAAAEALPERGELGVQRVDRLGLADRRRRSRSRRRR